MYQRVDLVSIIIDWDVELLDAGINIIDSALWNINVIQRVLLSNHCQLGIFLNAEHFIKHLKCGVLGFSIFQSLVLQHFLLLFASDFALSCDESFLLYQLVDLLLGQKFLSLTELFRAAIFLDLEVCRIWKGHCHSTLQDYIDSVRNITIIDKTGVSMHFVKLHVLTYRVKIAWLKFLV